MRKSFLLSLLALLAALPLSAQTRNKVLNIVVTTATGEDLTGQAVTLVQSDYQLTYSNVKLNAEGKATVKVYAGNHHISVARSGYNTAEKDFTIADTDEASEVTLTLSEKTRTPFALTATLQHNAYTGHDAALLSWNTEEPVFFDDFDDYEAFAVTFGEWTGIDADGLATAPLTGDYPNRSGLKYAQIINPLTVDPTWWYSYPVLRPYSGNQYVGFVRTTSGAANDDWLISPTITVGTDNVLTFMAKAADVYKEKFMVYVTTVLDTPKTTDFIRIDQGNYESANDYNNWSEYSYDLSAYAGQQIKFAIRYISEYNNGGSFMLMLDDVYVGPQKTASAAKAMMKAKRINRSAANPNETFEVYMDDVLVGTTDGYTYTIGNLSSGTRTFGVKAKYKAAESEFVTTTLDVPDHKTYCHLLFNVTADSKLSPDGQTINITNKATGEAYSLTVNNGNAEMLALPVGTYLIQIAEGAFVEYEQTVSVTTNMDVDIVLTDKVLNPYNITADLSTADDGTTTAVMKWNQELTFYDSFESYDDFATGSFGDWLSIDVDKNPVYPISLNGYIISFPGSGTQSNPTAIAPMVFNPWNTTPAMLPTDAAMQAPTGDKYINFFSSQKAKNDKWLISPELTVRDGHMLTVTAKSYSEAYPETFEFAVSTEGTDPSTFTVLSTASNMPADTWTMYQTDLSAYAGQKVHIGVHYTSYDTFMAQLDNFTISPEDGEAEFVDYGNVDHYNIYLDGEKVGESTESTFTLTGLTAGEHTVGIEAIYKNAQSDISTYVITVTGIGAITTEAIPATAEVFNLSGQSLGHNLPALPHGIYLVKYDGKTVKVSR